MATRTETVEELCSRAKLAARRLATLDTATKDAALAAIADALEARADEILEANSGDLDDGRAAGLEAALIDRLALDEGRIAAMAAGCATSSRCPTPSVS